MAKAFEPLPRCSDKNECIERQRIQYERGRDSVSTTAEPCQEQPGHMGWLVCQTHGAEIQDKIRQLHARTAVDTSNACTHAYVRIREFDDGHAIVCDDCSLTLQRYVYRKGEAKKDQSTNYGDWLSAEEFNALRTGETDPAAGLGEKDVRGFTAIEREFVGSRLHMIIPIRSAAFGCIAIPDG